MSAGEIIVFLKPENHSGEQSLISSGATALIISVRRPTLDVRI